MGVQRNYLVPSAMSRSTVLTGATTIKGIMCRAARTAALYVPICQDELSEMEIQVMKGLYLVGCVPISRYPICADG
jgi:hypothetical protein